MIPSTRGYLGVSSGFPFIVQNESASTALSVTSAGVVSATTSFTAGGIAVPTISSSDTLSNKTLSSPTISGTVAGTPTFSSAPIFSAGFQWENNLYGPSTAFAATIGANPAATITNGGYIQLYGSTHGSGPRAIVGAGTGANFTITASAISYGGVAIPTISSTDTLSNKTLSSPTLSGTVAGGPTFSGLQSYSVGSGTTYAEYSRWIPTNYAAGKPYLYIAKSTVAVRWDIGTWDGVTNANEINFTTPIMYNGVAIPTISSSDTLSNKTLSSPTVSGTIAGAATWSGTQTFSTVNVQNGTGVNSFKITDSTVGTALAFTPVEPGGIRRFQLLFSSDGTAPTSWGFIDGDGLEFADGKKIAVGTTIGTKIGTSTSQKLGFFNKTPVVQPTAVADATGAGDVVAQLNALLSRMRDLGLIAT